MSDDTDHPPRSRPTPTHGSECRQEDRIDDHGRRIRDLERHREKTDERLGDGAITMERLTMSMDSLRGSLDALARKMEEQAKPNPTWELVKAAVINSIIPIIIIAVLWAINQSGATPQPHQPPAAKGTP